MTLVGRESSQKLANNLLLFLQKTVLTGSDISMCLKLGLLAKHNLLPLF